MDHDPDTSELTIGGERRVRLRPIRRDDAEALVAMALRSTTEDLRLRFFTNVRPEVGALTTLLTQFDADRQIAVAAYEPGPNGGDGDLLGVVRLILSPDESLGEFAIMVRSDEAGHGLGHALMDEMLRWSRDRKLARVEAVVLSENKRMLRLAHDFGARIKGGVQGDGTVRVVIDLPTASV